MFLCQRMQRAKACFAGQHDPGRSRIEDLVGEARRVSRREISENGNQPTGWERLEKIAARGPDPAGELLLVWRHVDVDRLVEPKPVDRAVDAVAELCERRCAIVKR